MIKFSFIICGLAFFASQSLWAAVSCTGYTPAREDVTLNFTLLNTNPNAPSGTRMAYAKSSSLLGACSFTGGGTQSHTRVIQFHNTLGEATKKLLRDNGVKIMMAGANSNFPVDLTSVSIPVLQLGTWDEGSREVYAQYSYDAIKVGNGTIKNFDTGLVPLGYHTDYQGQRIGPTMFYIRISSQLVTYCPSPQISINTGDGSYKVDFGTNSPSDFNNGKVISKPFNLILHMTQCQLDLPITVSFHDPNAANIGGSSINLSNGLNLSLTRNGSLVNMDYSYMEGYLSPNVTKSIPYVARLRKQQQNSESIRLGPFSKLLRITIMYP